ncbi:MAG: DNA topoisomerase, partial [Oscillospiraceae bacterium]|nr:DNA topoisomerase [Oscillospiraceae bacterium]
EINCKGKTYFAYTDAERDKLIGGFGNAKYTVSRSKGLGENEAEMMSLTTMNPATRRLIQINMDEAQETLRVFEMLEGDDIAARKKHIAEEGYKYIDLTDVS